jgi:hypothetical protein
MALSPAIEAAIQREAQRTGLDPATLRSFVMIESGGNPGNRTGSYRGLLQLSPGEFARHGGQGDIYDVDANLSAGATKLQAESADFERRYGRKPTAGEIYMQHQQGVGGSAAHWANPDAPAWQNMASTGEGRRRGEGWAKDAIWGNVPSDVRSQYGNVDNITSKQFTDLWNTKVERFGGGEAPQTPASSTAVAGVGGNAYAVPFGLSIPTTAEAAPQQVASSTPAASGSESQDSSPLSLGGLGGDGKMLKAVMADEPKAKEDDPLLVQQQQLAQQQQEMMPQQPINLSRLMAVLQNRARLGTA